MIWQAKRLLSADGIMVQAWNRMIRKVQTTIETMLVRNTSGTEIPNGTILTLYNDGLNTPFAVRPACRGDDWDYCGVSQQLIQVGDQGICRSSGVSYVRLVSGLEGVDSGSEICLGALPGMGSTFSDGSYDDIFIGIVQDPSGYNPYAPDGTTGVTVLLRYRCAWPRPPEVGR